MDGEHKMRPESDRCEAPYYVRGKWRYCDGPVSHRGRHRTEKPLRPDPPPDTADPSKNQGAEVGDGR